MKFLLMMIMLLQVPTSRTQRVEAIQKAVALYTAAEICTEHPKAIFWSYSIDKHTYFEASCEENMPFLRKIKKNNWFYQMDALLGDNPQA